MQVFLPSASRNMPSTMIKNATILYDGQIRTIPLVDDQSPVASQSTKFLSNVLNSFHVHPPQLVQPYSISSQPLSLQTCQRIYGEARLIPFKLRIFDNYRWYGSRAVECQKFLSKLTLWQVKAIRNVRRGTTGLGLRC